MGGARRYLAELDRWRAERPNAVEVIGRDRALRVPWLVLRETVAARMAGRTAVALNNVSFVTAGERRVVLLRNVLHFLSCEEKVAVPRAVLRQSSAQGRFIRLVLRRADRIVVPSHSMRSRVLDHCSWAVDKIEVMHHPVSPSPKAGHRHAHSSPIVLCPVLDAPYKQLGKHLRDLGRALRLDSNQSDVQVSVTSTHSELREMGLPEKQFIPIGRLTTAAMAQAMEEATALYYPTELESFGYPFAEARVNRIPVVARRTAVGAEVAGDAFVPYESGDVRSLADAVGLALRLDLGPLGENPFDPDAYFRRLFLAENTPR